MINGASCTYDSIIALFTPEKFIRGEGNIKKTAKISKNQQNIEIKKTKTTTTTTTTTTTKKKKKKKKQTFDD